MAERVAQKVNGSILDQSSVVVDVRLRNLSLSNFDLSPATRTVVHLDQIRFPVASTSVFDSNHSEVAPLDPLTPWLDTVVHRDRFFEGRCIQQIRTAFTNQLARSGWAGECLFPAERAWIGLIIVPFRYVGIHFL